MPDKLDKAEAEWSAAQPQPNIAPVVVEEPIDPELQTGESRLLGGAMSIHSPWKHD